ncbi:hypothetical protein D3C86_2246710 [compost metagenome]
MSELPVGYLVAAWIEPSTPKSSGLKNSGVAQALSIVTTAEMRCAAAVIAGTSCISKVLEPGASR